MKKSILVVLMLATASALWAGESPAARKGFIGQFGLNDRGHLAPALNEGPVFHRGDEWGTMQNDSLNVRLVGRWPYGPAETLAVDETRAITFMGCGGVIYALDTSDPATPVKLSEITTRGYVTALYYIDNSLLVTDATQGLRIFSVSDPANPVETGSYDTPGYAYGMTVSGSYAYVANGDLGLRIISIADPENPVEVGSYDSPGLALRVIVRGPYACVGDFDGGLRIISVSDPESP